MRQHGVELMTEPESFLVTFSHGLVPEEEERAPRWGAELASHLGAGIS